MKRKKKKMKQTFLGPKTQQNHDSIQKERGKKSHQNPNFLLKIFITHNVLDNFINSRKQNI